MFEIVDGQTTDGSLSDPGELIKKKATCSLCDQACIPALTTNLLRRDLKKDNLPLAVFHNKSGDT